MAGDGCGHFVWRGIPAILHIALAAGDGHRDNEEVGVVRHSIRRQAVQVEGDGRPCHNAFPRGQRDVLAVQRYAVDFVIAQIFCQQHDAVGRVAVLAAVALDHWGKAELHGCFKALRCLAGVGHKLRVAVLFQRAQRQTVLVLAVIAVVVTPLGREIGLRLVLGRAQILCAVAVDRGCQRRKRQSAFQILGQADVLLAILSAEIISMPSICQLDGPSLVCRVFGVVFQHRDNFIIELHPRVIWRLALIPVKAAVIPLYQPELNLRCRQGVHKGLHGAGPGVVYLRRVVVGVVGRYTHDEVTRPRFICHKGIAALVDVSFQIGNCIRFDSTRIVAGQNFNTVVSGGAGILVAVARLGPRHFITAIDVVVRVLHLAGLDVDFSRLGGLGAVQHVLIVVLDDLVGDVGNINV